MGKQSRSYRSDSRWGAPGGDFGPVDEVQVANPLECGKWEAIFPGDGEVQVRCFLKLFVMNVLQGADLAGNLHLYQWPGTVPRSYASWLRREPDGTRSRCAELLAVCCVLRLVFRVKSFGESAGYCTGCQRQLRLHAGESGK